MPGSSMRRSGVDIVDCLKVYDLVGFGTLVSLRYALLSPLGSLRRFE
jgi:hypothetical protein